MACARKKILLVGAEIMPFAATGGLGDVLGSLPLALKAEYGRRADIRVVMPLYSAINDKWKKKMKLVCEFTVPLAWRQQYCGVKMLKKENVIFYFIDNEYYFKRDKLYGNYDDGERYAYFCRAVMEMMPMIDFYPDILHAHDWQAALTVVYLKQKYAHLDEYRDMKAVFTIHNIEYQGKYSFAIRGDVFDLDVKDEGVLDFGGCINLMKAAIVCADMVNTVSPTYAKEIMTPEFSHGLDPILNMFSFKVTGILNGIDYTYYDPENDATLPVNFSAESIDGKYEAKLSLQRELSLPEDKEIPVLAVISRLASHKGLDLLTKISYNLMYANNVQLVLLGTGEDVYEKHFAELECAFPDKVRALIKYDRDLSKRIYAAADIFIMPSKSEPCGLSQMIASRYGAFPVVRETGGLYDSIKGYYELDGVQHGNGFTFANYSSDELKERIEAALALWSDVEKRESFVRKVMTTDFSWGASAKRYIEMYEAL